MDEAVRRYIDGIDPAFRPLFDQIHELVIAAYPEAAVVLSYQMPTYKAGKRRLYVGTWQHGISLYGWQRGGDGGFTERHPGLLSGKGTIRLRPQDVPVNHLMIRSQLACSFQGSGIADPR